MLRIEMLPAGHGDAILVAYGDPKAPRYVLVDGGTRSSYPRVDARLAKIAKSVELELLIVTHIDEDHIGGTLRQLVENPGRLAPKDVWFNAYKHLSRDRLGAAYGEALSTAIEERHWTWNDAFGRGKSVVVPDEGVIPQIELEGGARLTLLSPTWDALGALIPSWEKECAKAGIAPGEGARPADVLGKHAPPDSIEMEELLATKFKEDASKPNGSSIAFLFEYEGKRALLGADAHPSIVLESLQRMQRGPVALDAFKVCHHGSQNNTSTALLRHLDCKRFLISTDGGTFGHPDPQAIARLVSSKGEKTLCFNYETDYSKPWAQAALRRKYGFEVVFPNDEEPGTLAVDL